MTEAASKALAELAIRAIEKIEKQYGYQMICCGCPVAGHAGDGWMQPPDAPTCCQQPDEDVAMLCATIRTAISAQPVAPEPVGHFQNDAATGQRPHYSQIADEYIGTPGTFPLYAAQPAPGAREPLSDEQIAQIASTPCAVVGSYVHTFARAIEAAHGILPR